MHIARILLIVLIMGLLSACCVEDKPDQSFSQNMYLERVTSATREVVETEVETSIIDGTTFPYQHMLADQSSFSFSEEWGWATGLNNYYSAYFFSKIPSNQDMCIFRQT